MNKAMDFLMRNVTIFGYNINNKNNRGKVKCGKILKNLH